MSPKYSSKCVINDQWSLWWLSCLSVCRFLPFNVDRFVSFSSSSSPIQFFYSDILHSIFMSLTPKTITTLWLYVCDDVDAHTSIHSFIHSFNHWFGWFSSLTNRLNVEILDQISLYLFFLVMCGTSTTFRLDCDSNRCNDFDRRLIRCGDDASYRT